MQEKKVRINSITCSHCVQTIRRELGKIEGFDSVDADLVRKTATIRWDAPATWDAISSVLKEISYPPED